MKPATALEPQPGGRRRVLVCRSPACAPKADRLRLSLIEALKRAGLDDEVAVLFTGCHGFCAREPSVLLEPSGVFYSGVTPADAAEIVRTDVVGGGRVDRLLHIDARTGEGIPFRRDIPHFAPEHRIAFRNCGLIDPESLEDSLSVGGYEGLRRALGMTPEEVVREVTASGLRGRGGRGIEVGVKWLGCREASGNGRLVVCNAEEGDPGCLAGRTLLEGDPHGVIEGIGIAAYAVGATRSILCVHEEADLARRRIRAALEAARERNLLGKAILGSDFDFDIEVRPGLGGLVRGEETALLADLEGRRAMPRPKPPFAASRGLDGSPTVIHWVETFGSLPVILTRGHDWFAGTGIEGATGTRVLAVSGSVIRGGFMEVPMGTPLGELVENHAGGITEGHRFKTAHIGGPTGGFIPATHSALPLDYESLEAAGAMLGSGGVLIMDETACVVDVARHLMAFVQGESCGKCIACRLGTAKMFEILTDMTRGRARLRDLELLATLAEDARDGALCALGRTASNPVLTGIRYFREEFEAHVVRKQCPARVCVDLIRFEVDPARCTRCGACHPVCPEGAVRWTEDRPAFIEIHRCTRCRACILACREHAID